MATIVATLNAASPGTQADNVTTDANLTYKVYNDVDSYVTPEVFGSHITDAKVTVAAGVVTITSVVDVGITSFKISSVDEASNESVLSDSFGSTIITLSDTFDGTSFDTGKWAVENSLSTEIQYTQNNELISTVSTVSAASGFNNGVFSQVAITPTLKVISFDLKERRTTTDFIYQVKLQDTNNISSTNGLGIQQGTVLGSVAYGQKLNGSDSKSGDWEIEMDGYRSFKIVLNGTSGEVFYWQIVGSVWASIGTVTFTSGFNAYLMVISRGAIGATVGDGINLDNYYVSSDDFSTQYPT